MAGRCIHIKNMYIFKRDMEFGHMTEIHRIKICGAIVAPGKLRTRSALLGALDIERRHFGFNSSWSKLTALF